MQALFELKIKTVPHLTVFHGMMNTATKLLSGAEKSQYTQAIVLHSAKGNEYSTMIRNALSEEKSDEKALLYQIQEANDSEIDFVLCMWQDEGIDIPSFDFRKLLLESNEKNADTALFVMTADGVSEIKLSATMK